MRLRLLLTVPAVLVFGLATARPQAAQFTSKNRLSAPENRSDIAWEVRTQPVASAAYIALLCPATETQWANEAANVPGVQPLLSYARRFLSTRYQAGGTSPGGFDCSGFVRYCFTKFGVSLPHSSAAQADLGAKIDRELAQPGDLIFFNGHTAGGSRVGHVGIITEVVNNQIKFIHSACSGGVKFDFLHTAYYQKRFVTIRRVATLLAQK